MGRKARGPRPIKLAAPPETEQNSEHRIGQMILRQDAAAVGLTLPRPTTAGPVRDPFLGWARKDKEYPKNDDLGKTTASREQNLDAEDGTVAECEDWHKALEHQVRPKGTADASSRGDGLPRPPPSVEDFWQRCTRRYLPGTAMLSPELTKTLHTELSRTNLETFNSQHRDATRTCLESTNVETQRGELTSANLESLTPAGSSMIARHKRSPSLRSIETASALRKTGCWDFNGPALNENTDDLDEGERSKIETAIIGHENDNGGGRDNEEQVRSPDWVWESQTEPSKGLQSRSSIVNGQPPRIVTLGSKGHNASPGADETLKDKYKFYQTRNGFANEYRGASAYANKIMAKWSAPRLDRPDRGMLGSAIDAFTTYTQAMQRPLKDDKDRTAPNPSLRPESASTKEKQTDTRTKQHISTNTVVPSPGIGIGKEGKYQRTDIKSHNAIGRRDPNVPLRVLNDTEPVLSKRMGPLKSWGRTKPLPLPLPPQNSPPQPKRLDEDALRGFFLPPLSDARGPLAYCVHCRLQSVRPGDAHSRFCYRCGRAADKLVEKSDKGAQSEPQQIDTAVPKKASQQRLHRERGRLQDHRNNPSRVRNDDRREASPEYSYELMDLLLADLDLFGPSRDNDTNNVPDVERDVPVTPELDGYGTAADSDATSLLVVGPAGGFPAHVSGQTAATLRNMRALLGTARRRGMLTSELYRPMRLTCKYNLEK